MLHRHRGAVSGPHQAQLGAVVVARVARAKNPADGLSVRHPRKLHAIVRFIARQIVGDDLPAGGRNGPARPASGERHGCRRGGLFRFRPHQYGHANDRYSNQSPLGQAHAARLFRFGLGKKSEGRMGASSTRSGGGGAATCGGTAGAAIAAGAGLAGGRTIFGITISHWTLEAGGAETGASETGAAETGATATTAGLG